ncbi:hypothetical protein LCGC14_0245170 [marine sediment metagenome]|uniref:Methyltransferase domain-containing protein n=1 Tax=marine sediment metagenome TaxID=412755 RepID=A0A0F9U6S8_9ZZZZ
MREEIIASAESCTFDYTPFIHPSEPPGPDGKTWKADAYESTLYKAAIAKHTQPKRILEIGIRAGYAAAAFLYACPTATYVGMDMNQSVKGLAPWGGRRNFMHHATDTLRDKYPEATVVTYEVNSLSPEARVLAESMELFDLVHVDGDHSEEGCLSDLYLARDIVRPGGFILADDFKEEAPWNRAQVGVTAAVKTFVADTGWFYIHLPSGQGEALISVPL